MRFEVKILGCSSALPAQGRHPSAQVLNSNENLYLIDCGEASQIQMHRFGVKRSRINHIFISHLHGDHVFGLVPLLSSYALYRRTETIYIYGPAPIRSFVLHQLECMQAVLPFEIIVKELDHKGKNEIMDDGNLKVFSFPLHHRVPTYAYIFKESERPPHILPDELERHDVDLAKIPEIKSGNVVTSRAGEPIKPKQLTEAADPPRSYAYMSDTAFDISFAEYIEGVDMLYHEATFAHNLKERADKTMHSTALQAAKVALKAKVGKLLLGHFSSRYTDLNIIKREAKSIFENTHLAIEGEVFSTDTSD